MKLHAKNSGSPTQARPVGILVLGMHRSGTSALARMLNLLGCALPSDLLEANCSNPEGHWESVRAIEINDSLLAALGRSWDDIRELPVEWLQRPETEIARQQIRAFIDREFSRERLWVLKEPRLCRLAPLWMEAIEEAGMDLRIVIPVRHPAEVAYSLARRDGIAVGRSQLLWLQHLLEAEAASRSKPRVLTHFHELLADWRREATHIASELGLVWGNESEKTAAQIDKFLQPELRHADARSAEDRGSRMSLPAQVTKLYETLLHVDDNHAWQAIAHFSIKMAEASSLYSPGIVDLAQRAERSEQHAATINRLVSSVLADPEHWQQNAERTNPVWEQSQGILSKVHETVPLLNLLIRQIEAQRREFGPAMQKHVQQITLLNEALNDREEQIFKLYHLMGERYAQIDLLDQALTERESLIVSLTRVAQESDERIVHLNQTLADRDRLISSLTQAVAENEEQILDLNQAVIDGGTHAVELNHLISERDSLIVSQDQQISSLRQSISENENIIWTLLKSRSWRLTRPLRAIRFFVFGKSDSAQEGDEFRFDPAWYQKTYPDVATSGMNPNDHYIAAGKSKGELPAPPPFWRRQIDRLQLVKVLPKKTIRRVGGVALAFNKARSVAKREGWFIPGIAADFDEIFYLLQYPDVAKSGANPYRHYIEHGKAEGRLGALPTLLIHDGSVRFDPSRETVLVVSHEASRTGAPVLSLNIVKELGKKFNVACLLLGGGPLVDAFRQEVAILIGPMLLRHEPLAAGVVIDELLKLYPLKFVIANSIESRVVLQALMRHGVPTVSLIHEFAAYTSTRHAFPEAILWAGETVFSAAITYEDAVSEFPELADRQFNVVPQGRCSLLSENRDKASQTKEDARVLNTLRPEGSQDDKVVIVGVGSVVHRKGVDLFIECAAKVLRAEAGQRCRFVWVGDGYDPEKDLVYSALLADQIRRSGLQRHFSFMSETSNIETAYKAADMLLISSRLDPLPNVAIDAMAHGLPVICFENTTGIADVFAAAGLSETCVAAYLDTTDMAAKVLALVASDPTRRKIGEQLRRLATDQFDMEHYVERLEEIASAAGAQIQVEKECAKEIVDSGFLRPDFSCLSQQEGPALQEILRFGYLRSWATGIGRRKLYPGFHPGIYLERHGTANRQIDPLVDYLRAGRPAGPWSYEVITSEQEALPVTPETRIALHLHAYFPDLLPEMIRRLCLNDVRPDLFVSVSNPQVADDIRKLLKAYSGNVVDIRLVPNRGRDIGSFLTAFGRSLIDNYDLVGHLHTKKTTYHHDPSVGRDWHLFLIENLLGGKAKMADIILGRMAADRSIGMVFPDDPNICGWGRNRSHAESLRGQLGLSDLPEHFLFPIGTMFWARVEAIRPILDLQLNWNDYPAEPVPYDGTILNALERLFSLVASSQGTRSVLTNVAGVTR